MEKPEMIFSFGTVSEDEKRLRLAIFCDEQEVAYENEIDDLEDRCWHVVAYLNGEAVGVGRTFRYKSDTFKIGRIAVKKAFRKNHIGSAVMAALEAKALEEGGDSALLSAQIQASGFYRKLGYAAFGEEYLEDGIPHVKMEKKLK